jgi:predicted ATPase/DNA-binding CsgD family transcriptional regulator
VLRLATAFEPGWASLPPPSELSSFVGRLRELAELEGLAPKARLITLIGPGGSGKTRLALELAGRLGDRFGDGVCFVSLAAIRESALLASSIAAALSIQEEPDRPLLETVARRLRDRELLLVLDNLEQLPTAAPVVAELLTHCPGVRVLATSRAPLHVRGEQEYRVDPLTLPDEADLASIEVLKDVEAVTLFLDRARGIDHRFSLTLENSRAIAEICRRMEGLPLAIELAAARTRLLSPAALLKRLQQRLPLLTGGPADAPRRQHTLRDTIAWSCGLLEPVDGMLFPRLCVFVGGFTLPAAAAVLLDPTERPDLQILDSLGHLVEQNLLRVMTDAEDDPRFSQLETIREFASESLSESDGAATRDRHLAYFLALAEGAEQASRGDTRTSMWRLAADLDNIRAALAWADGSGQHGSLLRLSAALGWFWDLHGEREEGLGWLDRALDADPSGDPAFRAKALAAAGHIESTLARADAATARYEESQRLFVTLGDDAGAAWSMARLSMLAHLGRRFEDAQALADGALAVARRAGDRRTLGFALQRKAAMERFHGRVEAARDLLEEAIAHLREIGDANELAGALLEWSDTQRELGDVAGAIATMTESISIYRTTGLEWSFGFPSALLMLSELRLRSGDAHLARAPLRDAVANVIHNTALGTGLQISALATTARWLEAVGQRELAVICWAAREVARAAHPRGHRKEAPDVEDDRRVLGAVALKAAWRAGQAMSLEEALRESLRALDAFSGTPVQRVTPIGRSRHDLTPRERVVLELVTAGRSDGEIAEALSITKSTASVHVANIKSKLGAESRVEIATYALRHGLVVERSPA